MVLADEWKTYTIVATGSGEKLEDWNGVKLLRPDPQIIWPARSDLSKTQGLHARYIRSADGGGRWEHYKDFPPEWALSYKDLTFLVKPTGFKHTGLFPEQAANWEQMRALIRAERKKRGSNAPPVKILNLFAYTGGATVACAKEGAFVTHVDAAKGMVERARTNAALSGLAKDSVRWIVEDCKSFILREQRRAQTYDAVIMDPPSYGRGSGGEVFKLEDSLYEIVQLCAGILTQNPLFFLLNSYTTGLGASVMQNILHAALKKFNGTVTAYELCLPTQEEGIILPCGNSALWLKA
ncbi:MAG: class I SAM-dependent methyltransferase [Firmicutes bacterium]|nr:class I SAM-dependent methyltransferase [Bacillota bacterium]